MTTYIPLESLLKDEKQSLYKLVLVAAQRANELNAGAKALVETRSKKPSTITLQEIAAGKVSYELLGQVTTAAGAKEAKTTKKATTPSAKKEKAKSAKK